MKDELHFTPKAFLQKLRMDRARALLESTELAMESIVPQCGYEDVSTFRRLFKRIIGHTPGEYRRRFRGE